MNISVNGIEVAKILGDRVPDNKLLLCCQECIELGGPEQWSPALGVMDILEHYDAHARMRMYLGAHHDKINKNSTIGKAYMPWRAEYEIKKRDLNKYLNDY